jgi:N-glycosylase/DNA lyase
VTNTGNTATGPLSVALSGIDASSFIISANNNIPRIKKIIESLCELCGERIDEYYAFPTAEQIVNAGLEKLATIGAGYRDRYIYEAAKLCLNSAHFDVFPHSRVHDTRRSVQTPNCDPIQAKLNDMSTDAARKELLKITGVGPKVADCILLFGLRRFDVFPSDVWVKRVLNDVYGVPPAEICKFAERKFGEYRGLAQQYLFYYYRENMKK